MISFKFAKIALNFSSSFLLYLQQKRIQNFVKLFKMEHFAKTRLIAVLTIQFLNV